MSTEGPRRIAIRRSLNRPTLLLGADREMVMVAGLLAGVLVFSLGTWWAVATGATFWVACVAALQRLGKADPLMRQVFSRHQRYQSYYPAQSRWCGAVREVPMHWKG